MRRRLFAALAVAALAVALPSSAEEPKTLDGDKNKRIEVKAAAAQQANVSSFIASTATRTKCEPPKCLRVPFKFDPVKGAVGDLVFRIKWTKQSDMDLWVVDADNKVIASCGATLGTGEVVKVADTALTKGKTYTLIAEFYATVGDEVTATAEFPGTYTPRGTPGNDTHHADCGLDG